jgi:hypothetical protein
MEVLEVKGQFMGMHNGEYPGAFPPAVESVIKKIVASPSLHFFSGSSTIGDVRVDAGHPNATLKMDVFDFMTSDVKKWKFVLADPPYDIQKENQKLKAYLNRKGLVGNLIFQKAMEKYLIEHAENVLWFDRCSPCPNGFYRYKTWLWFAPSSSWTGVRVLTWLKREGIELSQINGVH